MRLKVYENQPDLFRDDDSGNIINAFDLPKKVEALRRTESVLVTNIVGETLSQMSHHVQVESTQDGILKLARRLEMLRVVRTWLEAEEAQVAIGLIPYSTQVAKAQEQLKSLL